MDINIRKLIEIFSSCSCSTCETKINILWLFKNISFESNSRISRNLVKMIGLNNLVISLESGISPIDHLCASILQNVSFASLGNFQVFNRLLAIIARANNTQIQIKVCFTY